MRVTRAQAAAHREQILDAAGRLFREHGFDGVGVADIMQGAGLTHGGFYGHFASKDALATEATARIISRAGWAERITGRAKPTLADVVRSYLSPRHRDGPGRGCLFAAVGSDVRRQSRSIRRAFTAGVRRRLDALRDVVPGRSASVRRRKAVATLAGLVGALMLARAVDDPELSDEILKAATATFAH